MKKLFLITLLSCTSLVLSQCTLFQKPISSEKLAQLKQKYTPAQIDEGKTISMNSCKKCHRYHQASEFTARKWDKILVKMVRKAHLSLDSAREVHAYYLLNAKQG